MAVRQNFVSKVAMQSGASFINSTGYNQNALTVAQHAGDAMKNAENIRTIAEQVSNQSEGLSTAPVAQGGSLVMNVAVNAAAVFCPPLALAVIAKEIVDFSLKSSAGMGGELGLSAATFDEKGEMTSYKCAADGTTTSMLGKPLQTGPAASAARGIQNLGAIVGQVGAGYSKDEIVEDILAMFKKQKGVFDRDMARLEQMGAINPNDPKALEIRDMMAELTDSKPRPKALNVGMGSPSALSMG